jgi:hypothetical protein
MSTAQATGSSVISTPILIVIILAITIPVIIGLVIIVRASRKASVAASEEKNLSEEGTNCGDVESQKSLKDAVLESYRAKRDNGSSSISISSGPSTRSISGQQPSSSFVSGAEREPVVKYKKSKPHALNLDDNGNVV